MRKPYELYSVESRKGGVGKTTMALNLAKLLVRSGRKVLFIDCDISGTPISEASKKSIFWKDIVNPMYEEDKRPSNLLEIYVKQFKSGKINGEAVIKKLVFKEKCINVIASDIYDENGRLLIDPRSFMDDMNSYWMMSFIKDISDAFDALSDMPTAIVIDNSPGYVGLGKSVRNWLTDVGPLYSKFLLVSSLDEQDVKSVFNSADEIKTLMESKWKLATNNVSSEELKDVDKLLSYDTSIGQFYDTLVDNRYYPSSSSEKCDLKSYAGIIFNKIPEGLRNQEVSYSFDKETEEAFSTVIKSLVPRNEYKFPCNAVEYDSVISEQFMSSCLIPTNPNISKQKKSLAEKYKDMIKYIDSSEFDYNPVQRVKALGKSYGAFMGYASKLGYKGIANSLYKQFAPGSALSEIKPRLKELSGYFTQLTRESYKDMNTKELVTYDRSVLDVFLTDSGIQEQAAVFHSLLDELYLLSGIRRKKQNPNLLGNLSVMFRIFLEVQTKKYDSEEPYIEFLRSEYYNRKNSNGNGEWTQYLPSQISINGKELSMPDILPMLNKFFVKFYNTMCYTILRLIDGTEDFKLVVKAVVDSAYSDMPRAINHQVKNYLYSVVVKKDEVYSDSTYRSLLNMTLDMNAIQSILETNILSEWKS